MSARTNEWKLGFFVVLTIGIGLGAVAWIGARQFRREAVIIHAYFDEAVTGLGIGSDVKFRGMDIGDVQRVVTVPDSPWMDIQFELYLDTLRDLNLLGEDLESPADAWDRALRISVNSSILTGVAYLQIDVYDPEKFPPPDYGFEVPEFTIHSVRSEGKLLIDELTAALVSIPRVADKFVEMLDQVEGEVTSMELDRLSRESRELVETIRQAVVDLDLKRLSGDVNSTLGQAEGTLAEIRALVTDFRKDQGPFRQLIKRVDSLVLAAEQELKGADLPATAESARTALDRLGEGALDLGRAGDGAADLALDLRKEVIPELDETLRAIKRLTELLERDPGALLRGRSASPSPTDRGSTK